MTAHELARIARRARHSTSTGGRSTVTVDSADWGKILDVARAAIARQELDQQMLRLEDAPTLLSFPDRERPTTTTWGPDAA